jgi:hypothetical protein
VGCGNSFGVSMSLRLEFRFRSIVAEINPASEEQSPTCLRRHVPARPCCFTCRHGKPLRENKSAAGYDLEPRPTKAIEDDEYENEALLFVDDRQSLAHLSPAGKIPGIRKTGALIGFHRIDSAVLTLEENATPIGVFLQS